GSRTRLGGRAGARDVDPAPQLDRSTSLAKEPPSMSSTRPEDQVTDLDPDTAREADARQDPASAPGTAPEQAGTPIVAPEARAHAAAKPTKEAVGVTLEGLRAFYGSAEQVKGIDLKFNANEVTAIIGPSGSGKSTVVRCINRMHEEIPGARAEGRVLLDD